MAGRVNKMQEDLEVVDGDNNNEAPSNALEGPRKRARSSPRDWTTGGRCAGASRQGALEERVNKVQEERAIEVQEEPKVVDEVDEGKAPSKALEGPSRRARLRAGNHTTGGH